MGNEQKTELRKNGFMVIELWQFIVVLATLVFSIGIFYAYTTNTLAQHSDKLKTIEAWEVDHETKQNESVSFRNRKLDELIWNQKAICRKLGIVYEPFEGEQK
jgi:hypothetical protein